METPKIISKQFAGVSVKPLHTLATYWFIIHHNNEDHKYQVLFEITGLETMQPELRLHKAIHVYKKDSLSLEEIEKLL